MQPEVMAAVVQGESGSHFDLHANDILAARLHHVSSP
jgi:hypothetical protein